MFDPKTEPRKTIYLGALSLALANLQMMVFNSYLVLYLELDLLTAILVISVIVSLRNFLQLFFRVPLGELSQVVGRKPLVLFGHFGYALSLGLLGLADHWLLAGLATALFAIAMSAYWPALFSYVGDVSQDRFGVNNGRVFQGGDFGMIVGSFVVTVLLDYVSFSLSTLFILTCVFGLLAALLIWVVLPETLNSSAREPFEGFVSFFTSSFLSMVRRIILITRTPGMLPIYGLQLVIAFTEFMFTSFYPVLVVSLGFSKGTVSFIAMAGTLVLVWFKPKLGELTDRFGFKQPIFLSLFLTACAFALLPLTGYLATYSLLGQVVLYIVVMGSLITAYTGVNGGTAKTAPSNKRGLALGTLGFYVSMGRTTSTLALGPVWEVFSIGWVFGVTSFLLVAVVLVFFLILRKKRKPMLERSNLPLL